jgi:hypothetical protein
MDGRFIEAFTLLHKQRSICGYNTKQLCLRHRLLLEAFNSPFLSDGLKSKPMDVIIAARIFSTTDLLDVANMKANDQDREWMKKMTDNSSLFLEQIAQVMSYINENAKWPTFWDNKKSKGKDRGVPWMLNVICNLVKCGISLEQAWTMPECQAVWMHSSLAISEGADTSIVSEDDLAAIKFAKSLKGKEAKNG